MRYGIFLSEDGRILFAVPADQAQEGAVLTEELPEGNVTDYRYVNDTFVYDPLPKPEEPESGVAEDAIWDAMAVAYNEGVQSA